MEASRTSTSSQFQTNLTNWNRETAHLSVGYFNNHYFEEIVKMREEAVPFIYEELKKGPTLLVHALDEIYPNTVKYDGYVPLTTICNVWLNILSKKYDAQMEESFTSDPFAELDTSWGGNRDANDIANELHVMRSDTRIIETW